MFKEIVTKTILGKGKKSFKNVYTLTTEIEPTTVLGCWIINHKFKGYEMSGNIVVDGSFDVNIWYSYDDDTKTSVVSKKIDYNEVVSLKTKEETDLSNENEIIVRALKQPNCTKVEIKDEIIEFEIEKELGIELVGDAKVKVMVEETEEPWEIIDDEVVTEDVLKEIEDKVDENNIKNSIK